MSEPEAPVTSSVTAKLDKKKSIILGVIGLAVIVLIFWKVIPQIGSYEDALIALQNMGVGAMIVIGISVVIYLVAYGFPFMAATPGLKYWRSQQLNQAAFAISNGVPAGGAFGLAVQYAMLATYKIPGTVATAAITAVGLWSIFVSLGLPILGVLALAASGGDLEYGWAALLGLVILVVAIVVFVLVMRSEPLAVKVGHLGQPPGEAAAAPHQGAGRHRPRRPDHQVPLRHVRPAQAPLARHHHRAAGGDHDAVPDLLRVPARRGGLGRGGHVGPGRLRRLRHRADHADGPDHPRRTRHGGRRDHRPAAERRHQRRRRDGRRPRLACGVVRAADHHRHHRADHLVQEGQRGVRAPSTPGRRRRRPA